MAKRTIGAALLLTFLPIAGCGTVANLVKVPTEAGGKTPFGGVRQDMANIQQPPNGTANAKAPPRSEMEQCRQTAFRLASAADLPFSLIGDVVTWPYTVSYSYINSPVPVPPVSQAPIPPMIGAPTEVRPQPAPPETAPSPRTLP